ncbi:ATP phosphoribosyltransferase regulatory subunit, partial [bacterium]
RPSRRAEELSYYRFADPTTGRALSYRTDFTPQVARIAATRFKDAALPLRFLYDGTVVRHVPDQRGMKRELHQVGCELIGLSDPEGDAECVALLIECLKTAGLNDFCIDVGQVEFFKGIFRDESADGELIAAITRATARKDLSELGKILENAPLSSQTKKLLAELPLLTGGPEVITRAKALASGQHSLAALENLEKVLSFIDAYGLGEYITVDLGEIRGVDYYTGVIFEAFVHHLGAPLCKGGRYDRLIENYGEPRPATGFSIDLDSVAEALCLAGEPAGTGPSGVFIINYLDSRQSALILAKTIREEGVRASRDIIKRPLEDSLALAREQNFRYAVAIGCKECAEGFAAIHDLAENTVQTVETASVASMVTLKKSGFAS